MPLPESSNTLSVDCDGVIADKAHGGDYSKASPLTYGIEQVNKLYECVSNYIYIYITYVDAIFNLYYPILTFFSRLGSF